MQDTLDTLVGRVQQRTGTLPDYFLIRDWVDQSFREHAQRREWTWRRRNGQFLFYTSHTDGVVSVTRGSNLATFTAGNLTQDHVGRQIRIADNSNPVRTITRVSGNVAELDMIWGAASVVGTYEIYQAYATAPSDFDMFLAVIDPIRNFQLDFWSWTIGDMDRIDPRRAYSGNISWYIALRDFTSDRRGIVGGVVQAHGTGSIPTSGGEYTGPADAVFTVEMTAAAVFKWKKDNGAATVGVAIDPDGIDQALFDGVTIAFPTTGVYVSGDVFSIACSAVSNSGSPRMEPWPHKKADECLPFLYLAKPLDLTDPGAIIPNYVKSDLLLERSLAKWASWPGTEERRNPAFSLKLAEHHNANAERIFLDLEREDAGRAMTDVTFDEWTSLPVGVMDSAYLASHDVGFELNVLD